jgi:hypothetical protein
MPAVASLMVFNTEYVESCLFHVRFCSETTSTNKVYNS